MTVKFVDLYAQYLNLKADIDSAIQAVIRQTAFIRGKYVEEFEQAFARQMNIAHCKGVANGTDGLYIAMKMLGIGAGHEVITSATSWIASSETITQTGARVVFADIEKDYFCLALDEIEKKITPRTKAIVAVHLYGQCAEMDKIRQICRQHNLFLIEDCAQSHFSEYKGEVAGKMGDVGVFSFYPGKNLGAYGDAGAVVTQSPELDQKMRMYASHGAIEKHHHEMEGINSRLDGLQAAILLAKLPHLKAWNSRRAKHAAHYRQALAGVPQISLPAVRPDTLHTYHVFAIRTQKRDALRSFLNENNIQTAIHYPVALPLMPAYNYLGHKPNDFPQAFAHQNQALSLPMFPELTSEQIEYVAEKIKLFFKK